MSTDFHSLVRRVISYLNPVERLGIQRYSFFFPTFLLFVAIGSFESILFFDGYTYDQLGIAILFVFFLLIIYLSFRDGIKGGTIATVITIFYFLYITVQQQFTGRKLYSSYETILTFAIIYFALVGIVGWLKQVIDELIVNEKIARKAAQHSAERMRIILEQLPVGVMVVEAKTLKAEGNKQVKKILGRSVTDYLHSDPDYTSEYAFRGEISMQQRDWPISRALQGETIKSEELSLVRKDKKKIFVRINASPILDESGNIVAAVSTIDEITREKEIEKRKDDFVSLASHELKTPVTSISLYLDSLQQSIAKNQEKKSQKIIDRIQQQTGRLQKLINELLDVSYTKVGKLRMHREHFYLDTLAEEMVEFLHKDGAHTITFLPSAHTRVYADHFRISQVITHLILNAMRFSPEQTPITVLVKKDEKKAILEVSDFGIGVPVSQKKYIFERMYRVHELSKNTFAGLGLGLYLSKEIIKRHKGTIGVRPNSPHGSVFYFSLPLSQE